MIGSRFTTLYANKHIWIVVFSNALMTDRSTVYEKQREVEIVEQFGDVKQIVALGYYYKIQIYCCAQESQKVTENKLEERGG